ncbi:unnamed protein product [Ambrosiozyma monospora]|uniref:Unnamed protein product n=1 Tax=Ambrosiozyma monospora TaxID=43982 RepID=A0A9W7DM44_AMBMO|nr:unnamed protein product [Ambrosiozyma monospora]
MEDRKELQQERHHTNWSPNTKITTPNQRDILKTNNLMLLTNHTHKFPFVNNQYNSGNLNDKLSELNKSKSGVAESENELKQHSTPSNETISLITRITDNKIANYIFFKNTRFMVLGSFQRAVLWLKDPIMSKIPELFNLVKVKADGKDKNSKINVRRKDKQVTQVLKTHIERKKLGRDTKSNPIPNTEQVNVLDLDNLAVLLLQYLPVEEAIPIHIQRFFDVIYPFFPIFDEKDFRAKVAKILSYENGKPVVHFKDEKARFLTIACLLLVCRISYVCICLCDKTSALTEKNIPLLSLSVDGKLTKVVNVVLHRFNYLRKSSVDVLQLLMLLRFYQTIAPEDSDGSSGEDGLVINDLVMTNGELVGLNFEFSSLNFYQSAAFFKTEDEKDRYTNFWCKLWYCLRDMDLDYAVNFGRGPNSARYETNHGPAYCTLTNNNVHDIAIERFSVHRINRNKPISDALIDLLSCVHSVKVLPKINEVDLKLGTLENMKRDLCTSNANKTTLQLTDDLCILLNMNCVESCINYYILLKLESLGTLESYMNRFNILLHLTVESYTFVFDAALKSVNELSSYALFLIHRVILTSLKFFHFTMYFTARMMLIKQHAATPRHTILTDIIEKLIVILQNVTKLHGFCADKYYTSLRIYEGDPVKWVN